MEAAKGVGVSWTSARGCASLALVGYTKWLIIYLLLKDLISPSLQFEVVSIFFAVALDFKVDIILRTFINTAKMSSNDSTAQRHQLSCYLRILVIISAAVGILANAITILRIKDETYTVWFQPNPQFPTWGRPRVIYYFRNPNYLTIWAWTLVRHHGGREACVLIYGSLQSRLHGTLPTLHATASGKGPFIHAYQLSWTAPRSAVFLHY